tara:strand:- start:924 stop:2744 length:1821 start_codon:yes stop_codon:yes gene_type:complete
MLEQRFFEEDHTLDTNYINICKKIKKIKRKIKSVLLVQPIQIAENKIDLRIALNKRYYIYPPYALGILNSVLKKHNYNSDILDLNIDVFSKIHSEKKNINQKQLTNHWKKKLIEKIRKFNPDVIGVGCTFTMNHENTIEIAKEIKKIDENIIVLAGGVHVTNATEFVLKDAKGYIDFALTYEAENSLLDFLKFANDDTSKIHQISTMINEKYVEVKKKNLPEGENINIIPDYGDIDISKLTELGEIGTFRYWRPKNSLGSAVLAKKGCRARCSFCSVRNFNGKGVRTKTPDTVVDELILLKEKYSINHITWLDDDLLYDTDLTLELFNKIIEKKLDITWDASNGLIASAAVAHPELIDAAEKSGCIGAYFGLESGNDKILKGIYKPSGVKHYLKLGPLMNKHPKIFTRGFLMIGFPDENLSQIQDTINMAIKAELDWYTVQLLTPLPSTEIYDQMVAAGKAKKDDLNLDGEGFTMFSVRESERQRKIEEQNKRTNNEFVNLLNSKPDYVPNQKELNDLWFMADYEINYKPIFNQTNKNKLIKLECFLTDVSDRMTRDNPLSNYFLSLVKKKLGRKTESELRMATVKNYLKKSNYWKARFEILGLEA